MHALWALLEILKIMPGDAYNASRIIISQMLVHMYMPKNLKTILAYNLPEPTHAEYIATKKAAQCTVSNKVNCSLLWSHIYNHIKWKCNEHALHVYS